MKIDDLNLRIDAEVQKQVDEAVSTAYQTVFKAIVLLIDPTFTEQYGRGNWREQFDYFKHPMRDQVRAALVARVLGEKDVKFPPELWASRRKVKLDEVMGTMNALQKLFVSNLDYEPLEKAASDANP